MKRGGNGEGEAVPIRDSMGNWIMEYRCRRGHEWRSSAPTKVTPRIDAVSFRASPDELLATSGPVCPYCYTAALREQFGGEPVVTDDAAAAHEEAAHGE